jgi:hypothetical protein
MRGKQPRQVLACGVVGDPKYVGEFGGCTRESVTLTERSVALREVRKF